MTRTVIGVLGGSGGVGASSFAAVLAAAMADAAGGVLLVDADPAGGGIDVVVGIEAVDGVRWSGLRVGGGRLDTSALLDRLPTWRGASVLACDSSAPTPSAARQVVEQAGADVPVVVDLPRGDRPLRDALLGCCDLVVLLVRAEVRPLAAAGVLRRLASAGEVPWGCVLRPGAVPVAEAERFLDLPTLAVLDGDELDVPVSERLPRGALTVAAGLVDGLRPAADRDLDASDGALALGDEIGLDEPVLAIAR